MTLEYSNEDLVNIAVVYICSKNLMNDFDPSKGSVQGFIQGHSRAIIQRTVVRPTHNHKLNGTASSLEATMNDSSDGNAISLKDIIADTATHDPDKEFMFGKVHEFINGDLLSDREKFCLKMRFFEDKLHKDMDKALQEYTGNPKARSFFFINNGIKKMKNAFRELESI